MPKFDTTVLEPAAAEIADRNPVLLGEATALSQAISLKRIADSLDRLASADKQAALTAQSLVEQLRTAAVEAARTDDNPWIDWPGGECPVPDGVRVDVRWRNGDVIACDAGFGAASPVLWTASGLSNDIVAWRRSTTR